MANEEKAFAGLLYGKTAYYNSRSYIVEWVGLDSNGCLMSGDSGWNRSFVDITVYA